MTELSLHLKFEPYAYQYIHHDQYYPRHVVKEPGKSLSDDRSRDKKKLTLTVSLLRITYTTIFKG